MSGTYVQSGGLHDFGVAVDLLAHELRERLRRAAERIESLDEEALLERGDGESVRRGEVSGFAFWCDLKVA